MWKSILLIDEIVSLNSDALDQINYEFDSELDSDEIAQILIKEIYTYAGCKK